MAVVALMLSHCYLYNVTMRATAYIAMSEIPTRRLRQKTASLARLTQDCWSCM